MIDEKIWKKVKESKWNLDYFIITDFLWLMQIEKKKKKKKKKILELIKIHCETFSIVQEHKINNDDIWQHLTATGKSNLIQNCKENNIEHKEK